MFKGKGKLLELVLSGLLLLAANKADSGNCSKSFPVDLYSQTSAQPKKYPSKISMDLKFGKANSDYYTHTLEVILYTDDYQKEKKFYEYTKITKNRSSMHLVHSKEIEVGKINEEVYIHKMKDEKMTGKWYSIRSEDENNYKIIRKAEKYAHKALKALGLTGTIEDILKELTDSISYFENKGRDEALEELKTKYVVTDVPFHSPPVQGEITAWKFQINMKKTGKSYLGVIPLVNMQRGSSQSQIEGRFEGAKIDIPQE
jgi:hypothetical protein